MLSVTENDRIMRVTGDAMMGSLIRNYWLPIGVSSEVEPGGEPIRLRLFGEDLVLFCSTNGKIGLLGEHCPHRGASLKLARNGECALECIYHGWQIDHQGTVIVTPAEPERSNFKSRFRHIAYPVCSSAGILWAYLGDGIPPLLPVFEWSNLPKENILAARAVVKCNWAQNLEGAIDSAHQTYLHDSRSRLERDRAHVDRIAQEGLDLVDGFDETGQIIRPWNDGSPRLKVENTGYGFRYAAIRKPMIQADKLQNVRVSHFIAPIFVVIPGPAGWSQLIAHVPMDDDQTMFWHIRANLLGPYTEEDRKIHTAAAGLTMGVDLDGEFNRLGNRSNNWLQDRDEIRYGDRLSGIRGTINEDHAVMESMGPRFDRSKEHLGTSDMAVIRFRKIMLDALQNWEVKGVIFGRSDATELSLIRGEERTISLDESWKTVGVKSESAGYSSVD